MAANFRTLEANENNNSRALPQDERGDRAEAAKDEDEGGDNVDGGFVVGKNKEGDRGEEDLNDRAVAASGKGAAENKEDSNNVVTI